MKLNEQSVSRLIQDRQNKFIETRTNIENEVNRFLQSLSGLDADIKEKCGVRDGVTARDLLPALWQEPFDENAYNSQKASLDTYIAQVRAVCDQLNQEAIACLQS